MTAQAQKAGYFLNGMPYNRLGSGPRPLVILQGLMFENKPPSSLMTRMYGFLGEDYTVHSVLRRPGMPRGATLRDMADDYAVMIRDEFDGPVDVIGVSTGGSIAQHFAADHPDLVRRLVLHSSAHRLSDAARAEQLEVGRLAEQHRWQEAWATLLRFTLRPGPFTGIQVRLVSLLLSLQPPKDPSDLVITIAAEDKFSFQNQLSLVAAPTLVVAGAKDPFYTETLFRETAAGIPDGSLILYPGMGHPAVGKQFESDVLAFLRTGR